MKCFNTFSKVRFTLLSLFIAANVTACMKPSTRAQDPNASFSDQTKSSVNQPAATYNITSDITGTAVVSKNGEGFSVATEKLFTFKVCVQDKRTREMIIGHKFNIIGGAKPATVMPDGRSDGQGCVNWTEMIAYNGLADGKYIPLKRTLVADGMHTGARELNICINPWENSDSAAVRDCGRRPVPEAQLAKPSEVVNVLNNEDARGQHIKRYVWVNDLRVNATHNPSAAEAGVIDFSVAMSPKILRRNIRGEQEPVNLLDGVFSMQFWVIAKTGDRDQCYILAKSSSSTDVKMVAGSLQEELKMKLRYKSEYGQLELAGVVRSKETDLDLAPFNGVWILGDHTNLLGMKFGFNRPQTYRGEPGTFDSKKYVSSCIDVSGDASFEEIEKKFANAPSANSVATAAMDQNAFPPSSRFTDNEFNVGTASAEKIAADIGRYNKKHGDIVQMPGGKTVIQLDKVLKSGKPVRLSSELPSDLMTESCPEAKDIPRLFPKDPVAATLRPGTDFLSCINKNLPSGINRVERFEFGIVDVRPEPVYLETSTERTIRYRVITRVTNPLAQGAPVRDIEFQVEKSDGSKVAVRSNPQGDLIFNDTIHHTYFSPERYMLKVVRISHNSGFSKRLAIIFNPWDNNGFTFARDLRGVNKQTIAQVNLVERPRSELLLTQFQWGTQGFRYEVDNFLNLHIYKQFNLTLNPRVLRYSSLTEGRNKDEPLRAGIYLMKVAVQKDYRVLDGEPQEYIATVRKLVRVRNGVINEPVEIEFRDFRLLKLRTNLMIELATVNESKMTEEQRKTLLVDKPLDSLIDHDSDLSSRTFIGPVVAYSNGFSASMRPADDLSEAVCATIDCDEIKREYSGQIVSDLKGYLKDAGLPGASEAVESFTKPIESIASVLQKAKDSTGEYAFLTKSDRDELADAKKFVGSIEHLAKKTVSDMIVRSAELEKRERLRIINNARLSRLLTEENLEFAPIENEGKILVQDAALPKNNKVLQAGRSFGDMISKMAGMNPGQSIVNTSMSPLSPMVTSWLKKTPPTTQAIVDSVIGTTPMSAALAANFCVFFVENMVLQRTAEQEKSYGMLDSMRARSSRFNLNEACISEIARNGGITPRDGNEPIFSLHRRLRVFQLKTNDERRAGNLMSMNVSAGSSYGVSKGQSFSYGWSPTGSLSGALKLAGLGAAEKVIDVLGLSMSFSRSESKSIGSDTSSGGGVSLAVELRGMRMKLAQYERCTSIRFSQRFLEEHFEYFRKALPNTMTLAQKLERMQRGVLICDGKVSTQPIEVDERYYQFSQTIGDEVMNDPTSLENHPFLSMTIRGRPDYARLVNAIEAMPVSLSDLPGSYNMGELPLERLRKAFRTPTPSFPGLLTVEPDSIVKAKVIHKLEAPKK